MLFRSLTPSPALVTKSLELDLVLIWREGREAQECGAGDKIGRTYNNSFAISFPLSVSYTFCFPVKKFK